MKIHPLGAELFHEERQTDKRDEANSRFSPFCERAKKMEDRGKITMFKKKRVDMKITKKKIRTEKQCSHK
jgi:hypothetical protein